LAVFWTRWIGPEFRGRAFFIIFAAIAVVAAVRVVTHPRPIYSALYFVLVVLAVTGLCVLATATFLAAALVIVYGGAILVVYLFVIMLAQQGGMAPYDATSREPLAAVTLAFLIAAAATQAMASPDALVERAVLQRPTTWPSCRTVRRDVRRGFDRRRSGQRLYGRL
jgi:NADH:ubiquinone oxidoreductase subunit 6 (subunit J)